MYSREKLVCIISAQFHFGVKNKNSSVVFRFKKKEIWGRQYSNSNFFLKSKTITTCLYFWLILFIINGLTTLSSELSS